MLFSNRTALALAATLGIVLGAGLILFFRPAEPNRSILTTPTAAAPGLPAKGTILPCGHPMASFSRDQSSPASQVGLGQCVQGHSYVWLHGQWKADPAGTLSGQPDTWSPNAPR